MDDDTDVGPIMYLPNEIITMILQNLRCREIIRFGSTCKRYRQLITHNQIIWKEKFFETLPIKIADIVNKYGDGNWLEEMKRFYILRHDVNKELMTMSPKNYWRTTEVALEDMKMYFNLALSHSLTYHYVIYILQDIIYKGTARPPTRTIFEKSYNLTNAYYAKTSVRYLMQTFLTVKWVQAHKRHELTPDVVLNFFVQWTDPTAMHSDENIKHYIAELASQVKSMFSDETEGEVGDNIWNKLSKGLITERQILEAISDVLYLQNHLTVMDEATLLGLDIVHVFHSKGGHLIAAAVMYQAVAHSCGVHCELIAFPHHLFLTWRNPADPTNLYKIDLNTGVIMQQRRCPTSPNSFRKEFKYDPDNFLQYIIASFLMTMGAKKNWHTQNALFLADFLRNNHNDRNPYRNFFPSLNEMLDFEAEAELNTPLELEYIHENFVNVLRKLANLNKDPVHFTRKAETKHHAPGVLFAVGMQVCHKKYDYLCVIRGWDLTCTTDWCRHVDVKDLEFGTHQPFYSVIAVDQTERYVAQENLMHVDRPTRLEQLEDIIAREFCKFDGYTYTANVEKDGEYPQDGKIRALYKVRKQLQAATRQRL